MTITTAPPTRLRRLAAAPDHPGTVSLYLDVDGHARPRLVDCVGAFDSLAHQARMLAARHGEAVEASVRADLHRMRSIVAGLERLGVRGLAIFACHARRRFEVVRLPVPVEDAVSVGETADLGQLERLIGRTASVVVALVDRQHARIFSHTPGTLTALEEDFTALPRRHDQGGWSASSIQRHTDELGRRHLSRAAAHVAQFLLADPADRLLVGGPEEDVAVFIAELPATLRGRLAGRVSVRVTAGDGEVARAVENAAGGLVSAADADPVADLRAAVGTGLGVAGLAATLEALSARRCAVIVTSPALRVPGWKCPACGVLVATPGDCACGATLEGREDIAPAMTAAALLSDCRLAWVDDPAALRELGGIGALLRF